MSAYTGTVVSVDVSLADGVYTVSSASVMLQGSTTPVIVPVSGAFAAEVVAAEQSNVSLVGRQVRVFRVDRQPEVAYTIGVS